MIKSRCKICRQLGTKLFLKGEKCLSPKCPMIKKPYPPGLRKKRKFRALSEYGKELKERQKLKNWYNIGERTFKKYVKEVFESRGKVEDASDLLVKKLESRLDNVVFKLGFALSRAQAHQMVSYGHFLINGRPIDVPSKQLRKGDKVSLRPSSQKLAVFRNLPTSLKKHKLPSWLKLNLEKLEGEVVGEPSLEETVPPAEIPVIFEYYSR